jgi:hypothetical protein
MSWLRSYLDRVVSWWTQSESAPSWPKPEGPAQVTLPRREGYRPLRVMIPTYWRCLDCGRYRRAKTRAGARQAATSHSTQCGHATIVERG